jgi:hypothetical protein
LKGKALDEPTCQKNIVESREDYTTRINRRDYAYSINRPSSLITVCQDEIDEIPIPDSGVISLPETSICKFKFKNGPFTGIKPFAPGLEIQTDIVEITDESQLQKKMIEIKDHFQEYMYVYIPIILSITGLLFTVLLFLLCCIYQYRNRTTKHTKFRPEVPIRRRPKVTFAEDNDHISMKQLTYRPAWEIQEV